MTLRAAVALVRNWLILAQIVFSISVATGAVTCGLCEYTIDARDDEPASLRYRVVISEPIVCTGAGINLELALQNVSDHRLLIDPAGLTYQITISGESSGSSSVGDPITSLKATKYIALIPGESYRKSIFYPRNKGELFSHEGLYTLRITYGQFALPSPKIANLFRGTVESNSVLFKIKECSGS